jgi:hypothetical protein
MVGLFLVFCWIAVLISMVIALVYITANSAWGFLFPTFSQTFVVVFLMIAILTGVRWNPSIVLICISFMAKNIYIFHVLISCLYFFWDGFFFIVAVSQYLFLIALIRTSWKILNTSVCSVYRCLAPAFYRDAACGLPLLCLLLEWEIVLFIEIVPYYFLMLSCQ